MVNQIQIPQISQQTEKINLGNNVPFIPNLLLVRAEMCRFLYKRKLQPEKPSAEELSERQAVEAQSGRLACLQHRLSEAGSNLGAGCPCTGRPHPALGCQEQVTPWGPVQCSEATDSIIRKVWMGPWGGNA